MQSRMTQLHNNLRHILKQRDQLKDRVAAAVESHGEAVDETLHDDLTQIMQTEGKRLMESAAPGSLQRVFFQQQLDSSSKNDARGMRWHPLMIRWCIYLRHQSQGAYETLRRVVALPSQRTLRDYTYHIPPTSGFSAEVDRQLILAAKLDQCEEREKYVILLLDEMHIKEDLVYDKHTGQMIGFVNLGEVNNHLHKLEHYLSQQTVHHSPLADSIMTFMVRGLFSHLQFPYLQLPCHRLTGGDLYHPFWTAVGRLERCGFKVRTYKC